MLAPVPEPKRRATYEDLKLFRATPGVTPTPPVTIGPWVPFATATDLVRQQYLDFLGRVGDPAGVAGWAAKLVAGTRTIPQVIDGFLHSPEFGRSVAPAARMARSISRAFMTCGMPLRGTG